MKKLIAILLIVSGFVAEAQYPTPPFLPINSSYGSPFLRGKFDSALYIPTGCGTPTDTTWLFSQGTRPGFIGMGQKYRNGALYWDSCAHKLYGHDGIGAWFQVGGSGGTFDTTTIYRILGTKVDTASFNALVALVNGKMTNFGGAPGMAIGSLSTRPAASTLQTGTVYIAADSGFQYVDTGSGGTAGWKKISGGSGSAITQLTGDVTAGPGSGSQVDTVKGILNHVVPALSIGYLQWTGSAFSWTTPSGSADSAIWKNDAHYTGDHTLTMGSHTQTVVGNVWNFDSLNLLVKHYLYPDTIVWFGDSYFVGVGASNPVIDMASLTCLKLQAKQRNYAVSGTFGQTDITVQFANIPGFDSLHRYILMNWGVNDMRGAAGGTSGIDTTHFKDSVGRFIDTCIARGWPQNHLIYLSIINAASAAGTNSVFHSNYFSAQKNLCLAKGIVFIDMMTPFQQVSGGTSIYGVTTDGIHPNDQGHELYSTIIASTLGYHTVAQGQGLAVNKTIEANNVILRGLPYAGYKAVPLGVDTNGHLVNFNQAAFIPNNNDSAFGGNINLTGEIAASAQIEGGSVVVGSGAVTVPKNFTKAVLLQFNSGSNVGMVDALNFAGGALPLALNSEFGGGTVMIGTQTPFSTSDGFENNGKTYLADSLKFKRLPLLGYTTGDSAAYFKNNGDGSKTLEIGPPAGGSSHNGVDTVTFLSDSSSYVIHYHNGSTDTVHAHSFSGGGGDTVNLSHRIDTLAATVTFAAQGLSSSGDTLKFGNGIGFYMPDTLKTNGWPLLITGLASKATTVTADSMVIEDGANKQLKLAAIPTGGGGSGVTSVSAGYGMNFTTITATGSVIVDSSVMMTKGTAQLVSGRKNFSGEIDLSGATAATLSSTTLKVALVDTGASAKVCTAPFIAVDTSKTFGLPLKYFGDPTKTPTPALGTGAGAGSSGGGHLTNLSGLFGISTGTSPATSAVVATFTLGTQTFAHQLVVVLTPADAATAALGNDIYAVATGLGTWTINVGSTALSASSSYSWNYTVTGN